MPSPEILAPLCFLCQRDLHQLTCSPATCPEAEPAVAKQVWPESRGVSSPSRKMLPIA